MHADNLHNVSILLALSHPEAGKPLQTALMQEKVARVCIAKNNQEAIDQLGEQAYNMVLIEEGFPELGGADFCRFLRMVDSPVAYAPIIYGIISAEKKRVFAARDAGASKIVLMPLSAGTLLKTMHAAIREIRPMIMTGSYRGPDRRMTGQKPYHGADKRKLQQGWVTVAEQKRVLGSF